MGPGDYAVIEDTRKEGHPLVACTCLWRQEWEYEGIAFGVGQPEFVVTHPDYRNRGLIRSVTQRAFPEEILLGSRVMPLG
jgi:hypothetical protein